MGKYSYKAIDQDGNEVSGVVEAKNENDALNEISRKGYYVTSVHAAHIGDLLRERWQEQKELKKQFQAAKQEQARKNHPRQRLVVRYKDGRTDYGVCYALNPRDSGFHLDQMTQDETSTGKTIPVRFTDLKAVFQVRSFDGKFDMTQRYAEYHPEGAEVMVEFRDGEVIHGYTLQPYNQGEARFYLIPADRNSNNISILVEAAEVVGVLSPREYEEKRSEEKAARQTEDVSVDMCHEESMGDFYFQTRNYPAALEQYKQAANKFPQSRRLRKKLLATDYNIGVQYIKRRDYKTALAYMEKILKSDPANVHAKKKAVQLQRIIEKADHSGVQPPFGNDF